MSGEYVAIRTVVKNVLDSVDDIGKTFTRSRNWTTDAEFEAACSATIDGQAQLRWWWITCSGRESTYEQGGYWGIDKFNKDYTVTIFGFLGFDDSEDTEGTLATLAETVMEAMDSNTTLHGEFGGHPHTYEAAPCTLEGPDHATFKDRYLCNRVQISKVIRVRPSD